jgi:hypothetical protein
MRDMTSTTTTTDTSEARKPHWRDYVRGHSEEASASLNGQGPDPVDQCPVYPVEDAQAAFLSRLPSGPEAQQYIEILTRRATFHVLPDDEKQLWGIMPIVGRDPVALAQDLATVRTWCPTDPCRCCSVTTTGDYDYTEAYANCPVKLRNAYRDAMRQAVRKSISSCEYKELISLGQRAGFWSSDVKEHWDALQELARLEGNAANADRAAQRQQQALAEFWRTHGALVEEFGETR